MSDHFMASASKRILIGMLSMLAWTNSSEARGLTSSGEILHTLETMRTTGSVLYVAAHPDDENTRLITYLTRGRGYRTGYLSLTRGDGGQNLIGSELRESLGVIRTQELLAARRIDGGEQFFSRAVDFGYSKHPDETLAIWDREAVLSDVVRVVRQFRPDVIVTRFSLQPGVTHGHHTASAMLAVEAFEQAADPTAFPEQLEDDGLEVWQAKRVVWNAWSWGGFDHETEARLLKMDVGGFDPLLGESYGEISARSRSSHRSQGFGAVGSRGEAVERFDLLAGDPAQSDLMDGVERGWHRFKSGSEITKTLDAIIQEFDPRHPEKNVDRILALRRLLAKLPDEPIVRHRRRQLDDVLQASLGLHVQSTVTNARVVPGESVEMTHTVVQRSSYPVVWDRAPTEPLPLGREVAVTESTELSDNASLSEPYWLRDRGAVGLFRVSDSSLIGRGENSPDLVARHHFGLPGGDELVVDSPVVQIQRDPVRGELHHALQVVAPVTIEFETALEVVRAGESRDIVVNVQTERPLVGAGAVSLRVPEGWSVSPERHAVEFGENVSRVSRVFRLTAPQRTEKAEVGAVVSINGRDYDRSRIEIAFDHIPRQIWQPVARLQVVGAELETRGRRIGYLPGAGDAMPEALQRMGYEVSLLDVADMTPERLAEFDTVALGIRAYNTRDGLSERMGTLFDFAQAGGTVVVQYNTGHALKVDQVAPYALSISRDRVTDETANMKILEPDHPVFTTPNRITENDFDGWVQERGLYFPDEWGDEFTSLLECHDPGEPGRRGSLLVAKHGAGWFVYSGLSWFRQMPAGVPGAYRIYANLISLGHE